MAKKIKKVNPKEVAKMEVMAQVVDLLRANGVDVDDNYEDYGFTKGTIVIHTDVCDVQLKPITPKVGIDRYTIDEE